VTVEAWLNAVTADAERRGLPELKPLLESLARSTRVLREADFNANARGSSPSPEAPALSPQQ
jgi:hypothetical protein